MEAFSTCTRAQWCVQELSQTCSAERCLVICKGPGENARIMLISDQKKALLNLRRDARSMLGWQKGVWSCHELLVLWNNCTAKGWRGKGAEQEPWVWKAGCRLTDLDASDRVRISTRKKNSWGYFFAACVVQRQTWGPGLAEQWAIEATSATAEKGTGKGGVWWSTVGHCENKNNNKISTQTIIKSVHNAAFKVESTLREKINKHTLRVG